MQTDRQRQGGKGGSETASDWDVRVQLKDRLSSTLEGC